MEEIYDELGGGAEKRDSDDDSDEDVSADRMIMVLHVYDLSLRNLHICLLTDFMLSFVSYLVRPISPKSSCANSIICTVHAWDARVWPAFSCTCMPRTSPLTCHNEKIGQQALLGYPPI